MSSFVAAGAIGGGKDEIASEEDEDEENEDEDKGKRQRRASSTRKRTDPLTFWRSLRRSADAGEAFKYAMVCATVETGVKRD